MLKTIGSQIAELRWRKGLSQHQLAILVDLGVEELGDIECGQMDPDLICICQICANLEIEMTEFFLLVERRFEQQEEPVQFDLEHRPDRPQTLEQYRFSALWYQQKKMQFDWIIKKRSKQIEAFRNLRARSAGLRAQAVETMNHSFHR